MILHLTAHLTRRECLERAARFRAITYDLAVPAARLAIYQRQAHAMLREGEKK